jgi:hypothetical protein
MKLKKGKKGSLEYDLMLIDEFGSVSAALDFKFCILAAKEKAIVARHLDNAAKEIKQLRSLK